MDRDTQGGGKPTRKVHPSQRKGYQGKGAKIISQKHVGIGLVADDFQNIRNLANILSQEITKREQLEEQLKNLRETIEEVCEIDLT
jgi:hypothetical protein